MKETLAKILEEGVVPVIRVSSAAEAFEVAKAIRQGGISVIEVTMSVPGALDVMKEVTQRFSREVLLGSGNDPRLRNSPGGAAERRPICGHSDFELGSHTDVQAVQRGGDSRVADPD